MLCSRAINSLFRFVLIHTKLIFKLCLKNNAQVFFKFTDKFMPKKAFWDTRQVAIEVMNYKWNHLAWEMPTSDNACLRINRGSVDVCSDCRFDSSSDTCLRPAFASLLQRSFTLANMLYVWKTRKVSRYHNLFV